MGQTGTDKQQKNGAPLRSGLRQIAASVIVEGVYAATSPFFTVVAATGRLSINRKGTGTCPDDPVFSLCSVCGKDLALRASIRSFCQTRHRELTGICVP
jgi:hypothetical protein